MLRLNLNGHFAFRPVLLTPRQISYLVTLAEDEVKRCEKFDSSDKWVKNIKECADVMRAAVGVEKEAVE